MEKFIRSEDDVYKLLNIGTKAGKILLASGGEIFRVEDTIERMCRSWSGSDGVEVLAMTTSVSVTIIYKNKHYTSVIREKKPGFMLNKVVKVNNFSRNFVNKNISLDEAIEELTKIDEIPPWPAIYKSLASGITSSFFSVMFGGSLLDFMAAFVVGFIVAWILSLPIKNILPEFMYFLVSGFLSAGLAAIFMLIGFGNNIDMIIIGSLMPYVPGVVITNAIRDILASDYISGVISATKAIFIAIAIAFGVGIVLSFYFGG